MTFQTLFTHLEDVRKDISDLGTSQKLRIANYIEEKLREVWYKSDPSYWFSTATINVVSGTSSYARSDDYETDNVNNGGIYKTDDSGNPTGRPLIRTRYGSSNTGEYRDSTNIVFTPIPTKSAIYKHRYIAAMTPITDLSESSILPDKYAELWRDAALVYYDIWDEDDSKEPVDDIRFARILKSFEKNIPQSHGEGVVVSDFLQYF